MTDVRVKQVYISLEPLTNCPDRDTQLEIVKHKHYMKTFGLSCGDTQDRDDWRLRIKGQLADPSLSENGR